MNGLNTTRDRTARRAGRVEGGRHYGGHFFLGRAGFQSSTAKVDLVRSIGAHRVIDYTRGLHDRRRFPSGV